MSAPNILIAGIGNIFLGDDAFGCEVIKRLSQEGWPAEVKLFDFGIRGFDLAYALLGGYELSILIDAVPRGDEPGTVYTIEPDLESVDASDEVSPLVETHGMNPLKVLRMVRSMGGQLKAVLIVGCEPETFGPEEGAMGLSVPVAAAVEPAAEVVKSLVEKFLAERNSKRLCAQGVA